MQKNLLIYNSFTKTKQIFQPLHAPFVSMYVCGPTVYGKAHLGHARSAITFDIVFRYLTHLNYKVRYVRNITDVGHLEGDLDQGADKVGQQATLEQISPMEVAQRYTLSYRKNMEQLNVLPPSIEPCASGHILEQITMIEAILQKGYAYVVDGSVYFDVNKYNKTFPYGKLSGRVIEKLRPGTRVLLHQQIKRHAQDFALWKKASKRHIMRWPSPWSIGFPGWHIECSAMALKYLGTPLDIHGGGLDLMFPHHECEIAQVQASQNSPLATYWMHNNLVLIDGVKMGKSLNNFIRLDDLFTGNHAMLDQAYSPMVLRCCILQAHYRATLSVVLEALQAARKCYRKLINGLYTLALIRPDRFLPTAQSDRLDQEIYTICKKCYSAMNDDFNTAKLLSHLFDLLKKINGLHNGQISYQALSKSAFEQLQQTYVTFVTTILGLKEEQPHILTKSLELIMAIYKQAKAANQDAQVTFIRAALQNMGILIQDHSQGPYWIYQA